MISKVSIGGKISTGIESGGELAKKNEIKIV
jgi:hypothetical protein